MSPLLLYGKPCAEHLAESIANSVTELGFAPKLYTLGFDNEQWLQYTTSLAKSATCYSVEVQNITVSQDILPEEFFKLGFLILPLGVSLTGIPLATSSLPSVIMLAGNLP